MATRYFIPTDQATKRFYLFTQSWPLALTYHKEFANGGTKKLNNICTWVMHGLWLNAIQMGRFPVTFPPLTEEQKSQLAAYENPTDSQSDASFHQAMYEKHGLPCIHYTNEKIITNSETYLCKAAALAAKYDINKYLKDIKPKTESQSAYKISHLIEEGIKMEELADLQKHNTGDESIKSQIKSLQDGEVRFRPLIHTLTDDVGNQYIDQVYLYFDLNFKLIDNPYMEMSPVIYEPCIESPAQASSSSSSSSSSTGSS